MYVTYFYGLFYVVDLCLSLQHTIQSICMCGFFINHCCIIFLVVSVGSYDTERLQSNPFSSNILICRIVIMVFVLSYHIDLLWLQLVYLYIDIRVFSTVSLKHSKASSFPPTRLYQAAVLVQLYYQCKYD